MEKKLFEIYETDTKPLYDRDEWHTLEGKYYSMYDFTKNKYLVCYRNDDYKEDEMIESLIKENQQLSKKINHLLNELKELKEEGKE